MKITDLLPKYKYVPSGDLIISLPDRICNIEEILPGTWQIKSSTVIKVKISDSSVPIFEPAVRAEGSGSLTLDSSFKWDYTNSED